MILTLLLLIITIASLAVAGYAWWHAAKWAKLIAYARIAVEYKGKVKIDAPLQEWALWCEQTRKDKSQPRALRGHVNYAMGGTRIALFAGTKPAKVKPLRKWAGNRGLQTLQDRANRRTRAGARATRDRLQGSRQRQQPHDRSTKPADQ